MFQPVVAAHFDVTPRARISDPPAHQAQLCLRWQLAILVRKEVADLGHLTEDQLVMIDIIIEEFNKKHAPLDFSFNATSQFMLPGLCVKANGP